MWSASTGSQRSWKTWWIMSDDLILVLAPQGHIRVDAGCVMSEQARRRRFRVFMAEYYAARQADLLALEAATALYAAEVAEYVERFGRPMYFRRWLEDSRGGTR